MTSPRMIRIAKGLGYFVLGIGAYLLTALAAYALFTFARLGVASVFVRQILA